MENSAKRTVTLLPIGLLSLLLTACGGGGSDDNNPGGGNTGTSTPASAPTPTLNIGLKQLQFSWPLVDNTDHYRILENPDGSSGFTVVSGADNITTTSHDIDIPVHKLDWLAAEYRVEACNADESSCLGSATQTVTPADAITATGYFKASNTQSSDLFGFALALSGDGNTLAVGAYQEDSFATGIDGSQADNTEDGAGAVYLFTRSAGVWAQQAYIKASNTEGNDIFGVALTLSEDGNTLAVGAGGEDSAATGIDGNQADNSAGNAGAVYVYTRASDTWSQQAYIKASNSGPSDGFGVAVALSDDGNTLAVGANGEGSATAGINGNQADNNAAYSGAVYTFTRSGSSWSQQAYIKASNTAAADRFGFALDLSGDASTLAVGAYYEDSAATGIGGNQSDNTAANAGAVYVFTETSGNWSQQAYIKASNTQTNDNFGYAIALSDDGNTLAVGAYAEASAASGIGGNQSDNTAADAGAAYLFTRNVGIWAQQAYIKASNTEANDWFGYSIDLSGDGNTLAVGAYLEDSTGSVVDANEADNNASNAGAAYVYSRSADVWTQQAFVKASNSAGFDNFGYMVAVSDDGNTLAVGAFSEDSSATGVGGDQADNAALSAGAVYLY